MEQAPEDRFDWFELFNRHDPAGVILSGAPADEHEFEIRDIRKSWHKCETLEEFRILVYKTFQHYWGTEMPVKEDCDHLAIELWHLLHF
jgi:hypothetical protein